MKEHQQEQTTALTGEKDSQSVDSYWNRVGIELIAGVKVQEVKPVLTATGRLVEAYRSDWNLDDHAVGQVFYTTLKTAALSAWHVHKKTTDRLTAVSGELLIVLYDDRVNSPTYGNINEFRIGEHRPTTISVPPGVWHGVSNTHGGRSILLNCVDLGYLYDDPDHYRLPPDCSEIPYSF